MYWENPFNQELNRYHFMRRILHISVGLMFLVHGSWGQETFQPKQLDEPNKGIIYTRELGAHLRMHTNGFSMGMTMGTLRTYYQTRYWHVELGALQHPKEFRQSFDTPSTLNGQVSRAFKYGKQNSLFVVRAGLGGKRYFSEKARHKGVAVALTYEFGPTLGLLKPYYLELRAGDGRATISTKYSPETAGSFLNIWQIQGASSWSEGLGELSLLPGGHAKGAVHFDWGAFDEFVKAMEAGIMVDVFSRTVPIMVDAAGLENKQVFINLFLHLQFGKRW
jgi:hypothetical protein